MAPSFSVTWDYRCPFARNAHEHLVAALRAGAPWEVRFLAFSLDQAHLEEGDTPVFDEPDRYPGLLANLAGVVVRDRLPERFLDTHEALFAARHDRALDLRQPETLSDVLEEVGVDPSFVLAEIDEGWPLERARQEHVDAVKRWDVFGVPTFVINDRAVFVRLLHRPSGDGEVARSTIDRVLALATGFPELNEYKFTTIPR
jgi:hypothetical protein